MAAPQITAITVTPSRQNPSTFSADTDQFLSEVPTFQNQANAQADFNNSLALQVQSNSDLVALNTQATVGAANFKGIWADATGAATKGDSYYNNGQFFALNVDLADITASDPIVGSADWSILSQGVFDYVVSQFAGGDKALVGYIYAGVVVTAFDYLIYPLDGRVYAKNGATGTFSDPLVFDPVAGTDTGGISGTLINVNSFNINQPFVSSAQTITGAGLVTVAHGIKDKDGNAVRPRTVSFYIQCITNNFGYVVGDIIYPPTNNSSGTTARINTIRADATNIYFRFAPATNVAFVAANESAPTGGAELNNANWQLYLTAEY